MIELFNRLPLAFAIVNATVAAYKTAEKKIRLAAETSRTGISHGLTLLLKRCLKNIQTNGSVALPIVKLPIRHPKCKSIHVLYPFSAMIG